METAIRMPVGATAIDEEELLYLDGGADLCDILIDLFIPFAGMIRGILATRDFKCNYLKLNPNSGFAWISAGTAELAQHMNQSVYNAIDDVIRVLCNLNPISAFFILI